MSIWPKVWNAKIDPTTTAKKIVGDSIGSVTRQNRGHGPGAVDLRRLVQLVGDRLQPGRHQDEREAERLPDRDERDTAPSARSGFSRIGGLGLIPIHGSRPTIGLNSVPKITGRDRDRRRDRRREDRAVDADAAQLLVRGHREQQAEPDAGRHGEERERRPWSSGCSTKSCDVSTSRYWSKPT